MATEPNQMQPFLPGVVLVDQGTPRLLVGVPDTLGVASLTQADASYIVGSHSTYLEHREDVHAHLLVTGDSTGMSLQGIHATPDAVPAYVWRRQGYMTSGMLGEHPDKPAGAGVLMHAGQPRHAEYLSRSATLLGRLYNVNLYSASRQSNAYVVRMLDRRHPNPERNNQMLEEARGAVLRFMPTLLEFVRGFRFARCVRAHKVLS